MQRSIYKKSPLIARIRPSKIQFYTYIENTQKIYKGEASRFPWNITSTRKMKLCARENLSFASSLCYFLLRAVYSVQLSVILKSVIMVILVHGARCSVYSFLTRVFCNLIILHLCHFYISHKCLYYVSHRSYVDKSSRFNDYIKLSKLSTVTFRFINCLLYTSDAADEG